MHRVKIDGGATLSAEREMAVRDHDSTGGDPARGAPIVPGTRRRQILDLLRSQRSVSIAALEERFAISPMTARRDLAILARAGQARRTHGGAVLPDTAAHEDSFRHRLDLDFGEKQR